jgi:hypothetical protein
LSLGGKQKREKRRRGKMFRKGERKGKTKVERVK